MRKVRLHLLQGTGGALVVLSPWRKALLCCQPGPSAGHIISLLSPLGERQGPGSSLGLWNITPVPDFPPPQHKGKINNPDVTLLTSSENRAAALAEFLHSTASSTQTFQTPHCFVVWVQRKRLCSTIKQTSKGMGFSNVLWQLYMKISLALLQGGSDGSGSTRHAEEKQYKNRGYSCQTQGQAKASVSSRAKLTSRCLLQVTFSLTASAKIPEVRGKTDQSQSQNRARSCV